MAIDSLNGSVSNQIDPASIQSRKPPERKPEESRNEVLQSQAQPVPSSKPPSNRGQSVDIKA